jgi:hypothetical protein
VAVCFRSSRRSHDHRRRVGSAPWAADLRLLDQDTGEVTAGRIVLADRLQLRAWLERFADEQQVAFALEGCTGWRYVVEELGRAGIAAHLAEPAELRGPKSRARTDRTDAHHLRELLLAGACRSRGSRPPMCWRRGPSSGCTRTCWTSGPPGCSGCTPPCSTRACPSSPSSPPQRAQRAWPPPTFLRPGARPSQWDCARSSGSRGRWPAPRAACRPVGAAGGLPRPARDPLRGRGAHLGGDLGRAGRLCCI